MNEFAGLLSFVAAWWAALTLFDELQQRRRVADWRARAERIKTMRGTP